MIVSLRVPDATAKAARNLIKRGKIPNVTSLNHWLNTLIETAIEEHTKHLTPQEKFDISCTLYFPRKGQL